MSINLISPTTFTTAVLIGDTYQAPNGSNDAIPTMSTANGETVSAALELQSTTGALLIPRMTTTQRDALNPTNGMIVYSTNDNKFNLYINGSWVQLSSTIGTGNVVGSGPTVANQIARFNNIDATGITSSSVSIDNDGNVTGSATISNGDGSAENPSYTFSSAPLTGIYNGGGISDISFTVRAFQQARIKSTDDAVNILALTGNVTTQPPTLSVEGSDANIDVAVLGKGSGGFSILGTGTNNAGVKLWNSGNTFYSAIQGGNATGNLTWVWPIADATIANAPLVSNASGTLSFENAVAVNVATATLNQSQIQGLSGTSQSIVSAPGAGKAIIVHRLILNYTYANTTAYTGGGTIALQYGTGAYSAANAASSTIAATALTATNNTLSYADGASNVGTYVNTAVTLSNAAGAFAAGGADSSLAVTVWYSVMSVV